MGDPVRNFAITTVTAAPSPADSGTTLEPADAALFPDPDVDGAFNVIVWPAATQPLAANAEIIRVQGLAAGVWDPIAREQEGTAARSIGVGDQVMLGPTALSWTQHLPANWTFGPDHDVEAQGTSPDATPFGVVGQPDQTAPIFEVMQEAAGNDLFVIGSDGKAWVTSYEPEGDALEIRNDLDGNFRVGRGAGYLVKIEASSYEDDVILLMQSGSAAGNFEYVRIYDPLDNVVLRIDAASNVIIGNVTEPADAALNASELTIWLDDSIGATKVMFKAKDSAGTVRTGEIALS